MKTYQDHQLFQLLFLNPLFSLKRALLQTAFFEQVEKVLINTPAPRKNLFPIQNILMSLVDIKGQKYES